MNVWGAIIEESTRRVGLRQACKLSLLLARWHDAAARPSMQGTKAYLDFEFPEADILEKQEGQAR